jgi:hypothetical protein
VVETSYTSLPLDSWATLHTRTGGSGEDASGSVTGTVFAGSFRDCAARLLQLAPGSFDEFWIDTDIGRFTSYQIRAAAHAGLVSRERPGQFRSR